MPSLTDNQHKIPMVFNCLRCGKAISSGRDVCPYCKIDVTDLIMTMGIEDKKALREKYKGTILSFLGVK